MVVDEGRQCVEVSPADLLRRGERRAGGEDGEPDEHRSRTIVEEPDAPGDGLAKRPLAGGKVAWAAREHAQARVESLHQSSRCQGSNARRSQLDCERQAVDASADPPHVPVVLGDELEARIEEAGALGEELDGIVFVERIHGEDVLARYVENRTARHEEREPGHPSDELGVGGCRLAHVLRVVHEEEQLVPGDRGRNGLERIDVGVDGDVEGLRDRRNDERRITQRRKLDEHDTIRVRAGDLARDLEREPGLPAAPGSRHDDEARLAALEQRAQLLELARTSDECGWAARAARAPTEPTAPARSSSGSCCRMRRCSSRSGLPGSSPSSSSSRTLNEREVLERVRLPAGSVQREHRELVRTLPVRALVGERENLSEQLGVPTQLEPCGQPLLHRDEPQLLEPLALRTSNLLVRELAERATAPETERAVGERRREGCVALVTRRTTLTQQLLEPLGVENSGLKG